MQHSTDGILSGENVGSCKGFVASPDPRWLRCVVDMFFLFLAYYSSYSSSLTFCHPQYLLTITSTHTHTQDGFPFLFFMCFSLPVCLCLVVCLWAGQSPLYLTCSTLLLHLIASASSPAPHHFTSVQYLNPAFPVTCHQIVQSAHVVHYCLLFFCSSSILIFCLFT